MQTIIELINRIVNKLLLFWVNIMWMDNNRANIKKNLEIVLNIIKPLFLKIMYNNKNGLKTSINRMGPITV